MTLAWIDYLLVFAYLALILGLGLAFARDKVNDEDYMLAGRKLTLPAFVMTLVTTWYGAILGVGEFVFGYGVVGWITQGLFWYVIYLFFALFLARKIHDTKFMTVADQLRHRAGKKSAWLGAVLTFVMTSPAPYILSLGVVVSVLFPISLPWAVLLSALVSGLYIWAGGFRAVIRTDILQFVLMFFGFGALVMLSFSQFGGWEFLQSNLPATHLSWHGGLQPQTIIVWGLLALWTLVDPNFYQRCYAAKDGRTAQKGVLIATVGWFFFDMMTLAAGLYARAAFPETDPLFSYFTLADSVLPIVIKGVFVVTILSIIMSTIDSFLFASSSIIAADFLGRNPRKKTLISRSRIGIAATLVLSLLIIWLFESVIGIIYALGTVGVSALLLPTVTALISRAKLNDKAVLTSMIMAALTSGAWLIEGWLQAEFGWPVYRWNLEPMYVGLAVSAVVMIVSAGFKGFRQV